MSKKVYTMCYFNKVIPRLFAIHIWKRQGALYVKGSLPFASPFDQITIFAGPLKYLYYIDQQYLL